MTSFRSGVKLTAMKKLSLYIFLVLMLLGVCFGNSTLAKSPIEAISIEQYFDDGKDRSDTIVYVNGPVGELEFEDDPFSDKKEISSLKIKKGKRSIYVMLKKNLLSETVKLGDQVTVKFKSRPILNNYTLIIGELINGNIKVAKWSSKEKPKLGNLITVEDYFAKKLRFGNKRVTFEGTVYKFSKTDAGEVLIEFVTDSYEAYVYIDQRFWKKKEIKDVLKTLKEGDRVQVGGSFTMEGGMTIFSGETLGIK